MCTSMVVGLWELVQATAQIHMPILSNLLSPNITVLLSLSLDATYCSLTNFDLVIHVLAFSEAVVSKLLPMMGV